jgi:hypothetical protein
VLLVVGVEDGDGVAVGHGHDGAGEGVGVGGEGEEERCQAVGILTAWCRIPANTSSLKWQHAESDPTINPGNQPPPSCRSPDPDHRVWLGRLTTLHQAGCAHGFVLRMDDRQPTRRSGCGEIGADGSGWPEAHQDRVVVCRMKGQTRAICCTNVRTRWRTSDGRRRLARCSVDSRRTSAWG